MSRRTIMSLAASIIIGIGFVGAVSTDPPHIIAGMVFIAVARIAAASIVVGFTVVATIAAYALE